MTPRGVLAFCREKEIRAVDLRFCDLLGSWHHVTVPVNQLQESSFEEGFGINASNLKCSSGGDRLVMPESTTGFLDPFAAIPTLALICNLIHPVTRDDDTFDPRLIASRAADYLKSTGIADRVSIGPECEFFLFDQVQYSNLSTSASFAVGNSETSTADGNSGRSIKIRPSEGYSPCSPIDQSFDLRNEMMEALIDIDINVAMHHHGIAAGGQSEMKLEAMDFVRAADAILILKHVVRNVATKFNHVATFMPKPIDNERGSAMHMHFSLWKGELPIFSGQSYAGLSETALYAIGGILHHARSLSAICNPTTNSYKRLHHPTFGPLQLGYSQAVRKIVCRIPSYSNNPKTKRVEVRLPDPSANPYLAYSAVLMAAIDGIQNKIDPGKPLQDAAIKPSKEYLKGTAASSIADRSASGSPKSLPRSLWMALEALESDFEFLTRGDVFTEEMIRSWLGYKWTHEHAALESSPTPAEYCQYFDC